MATLNMKGRSFLLRELFAADPTEGRPVASLSVAPLASAFCRAMGCDDDDPRGCRRHSQALMLGFAKMMVQGEALAEMSPKGVVFARLSPKGVLVPADWEHQPDWWHAKPDLVEWARIERERARERVQRYRLEARY